jgi:DNA adenine methylase
LESIRETQPLRTLAPYIGGKRNLARRLITLIETVPHRCYAEPFLGIGGVFFKRRLVPETEIINDFNRDIATLFRILQRHYVPFMDMLRFQLTTRAGFERLTATAPETLTDLERAARFLYLQRTAFGGNVRSQHFGTATINPKRFDVSRLAPLLEDVHVRLSRVVIECLPWQSFIDRYDRPHTLFYLDPPYWGSEKVYGESVFERPDFDLLATRLRRLEGRFILSINDRPEIRAAFVGFTLEPVETTYTLPARGPAKRARELIITPATDSP